jgi:hypothetical protein
MRPGGRRFPLTPGSRGVALVLISLLLGSACAPQAQTGAVVGAGTGALVGAMSSGGHGPSAVLGAVIGGLLGALVGETAAHQETRVAAGLPPGGPPPPPGGQWIVMAPPPPLPPGVGPAPPPDPTRGVFTNSTPWEVHVFIDTPPGSPGPLVLGRGQSAPAALDIGRHRIVAQAFVDTQFGRRLVGTFDQILAVDPRAPGWTIRFFEANF